MLGHTYRYQVYNGTGVSVTVAIDERRWKFASDGSVTNAAESTAYASASLGTLAYGNGSTVDNSTDKYIGAHLECNFAPASSATGTVSVWVQRSTDGGTTWPGNGLGEFIGAHYFSASSAAVVKAMAVD